jgi:asparagine synthase (glutamine-hydrolysing)
MCGIAGFVERTSSRGSARPGARIRLESMLRAIEHRGPDDWGMAFSRFPAEAVAADQEHVTTLSAPSGVRLALGHRRLAILDLSPSGRQPMTTPDGALTVTFNGEIYNYVELRRELARNAVFRTGTDTEVLLEAYRQWGTEMLGRLDGMFAFALWDASTSKLLCARDPLGIKPFYYSQDGERFLFASEPRAVLAGLGSAGHMDAAHVAEFLVLGISDHDDGTSYREVRQLGGGHWFEVKGDGSVSASRAYWRPPIGTVEDQTELPARVREQINLAIERQLRSDAPVGSCLSGGLDSGSIVSLVGRFLGSRASDFTTLTLANEGFQGDESETARVIAKRAGVRWLKVEPGLEGVNDDLDDLVRTMGEPFSTLSMLGQYKVMQAASQEGLKVMLDGQGGDEVFLGYPRVAQRVIGEYFKRGYLPSAVREWRALSRNAAQPLVISLIGNIFRSSPRFARWRNGNRLRGIVEPSLLEQVRPAVADAIFNHQDLDGIQIGELTRFNLPRLLRYEDRNSMAFGLEARVPLLAIGVVELVLRLPIHWKVRDGWTKYALRVAMNGQLPQEVLWHRCKRGFEVPQRCWVQSARSRIAERLAALPADAPINGAEILARIDAGQGGAHWLWRCLSVALWIRSCGVRV